MPAVAGSVLRTSRMAAEVTKIAGCEIVVLFNCSAGPSKQIVLRSRPVISLAFSKISAAAGNARAISAPIPIIWAPCPGNRKAVFMFSYLVYRISYIVFRMPYIAFRVNGSVSSGPL
jgi:hypothetical protein